MLMTFLLASSLSLSPLPGPSAPDSSGSLDFAFTPGDDLRLNILDDQPSLAAFQDDASTTSSATSTGPSTAPPFGTVDTWRWNLFGALGSTVKRDTSDFGRVSVGASYFIAENFSIDVEAGLFYFVQEGEDAVGLNGDLLLRWHFFAREDWSIYADGGAGVLVTTNDVPQHGSSFNFTPQLGLGFTYEIDPNVRLIAGARWYHVSNANLYDVNPGLDHVMVYAGVSFPF